MVALLAVFALSCASARKEPDYSKSVWPPPPEKTRVKLLKVITTDADFRKPSFTEKLFGIEAFFSFKKPHGIAVDKRGNIYVSDSISNNVVVMNVEEGTFGFLDSPFGHALPLGLAYDEKMDWLAIADAKQKHVVVMDAAKRTLVVQIGQKGEFQRPVAAAFDADRQRIYVADTEMHKIRVFDFEGKFISDIGEKGGSPGKLYYPTGIKVDKDGNILVVNSFNFRFDIFEPGGKFVKSIGEHGDLPGMFARPKDLAIDSEGHIYVTDAAFNHFQIFDKNGNVYLFVGGGGELPGYFLNPQGIFIDPKDRIYVTDQVNKRVQIYQYVSYPGEDITNAVSPEAEGDSADDGAK